MNDIAERRRFMRAADAFARKRDYTIVPELIDALLVLLADTFGEPASVSVGDLTVRRTPRIKEPDSTETAE